MPVENTPLQQHLWNACMIQAFNKYWTIIMPLPNKFLACLSVRPSVCDVFSLVITKEPLVGLSWNCRYILSTSKLRAELFFQGCGIQDGRLSTTYTYKYVKPILVYIFVLNWDIDFKVFHFYPEVITKVTENYQKLPKITRNCRTWLEKLGI